MSISDDMLLLYEMEEAIKAHPEDGVIWEDSRVIIRRDKGKVTMTGKPFNIPFQYESPR